MSSNLKVNTILPSTGTNVAIGTAGGSVDFAGTLKVGIVTARDGQAATYYGDVIGGTVSGTTGSFSGSVTVGQDLSIPDKIVHSGDSNTAIRFPTNDIITAETGGSERLRIDSSGRLMIGNTNASTMYQDGGDDLVIGNTSGSHGMTIISQDNNVGRIMFSDTYTSGTGTYEGQILYSHALNTLNFYSNYTSNSNLVMSLGGSNGDVTVHGGNVIIGTSGKGIDFSAASGSYGGASASILDDYEEGTWTLGVGHDAITSEYGRYTKIGRMVYATFEITFGSSSNSGHQYISGLPFTSIASSDDGGNAGGVAKDYQTYDIENGPIYHIGQNNTLIYFYKNSGQTMAASNTSGYNFRGTAIYTAA